ncbi:protein ALWAYS EARLY 2-like isoform X2 [Papaver somniferum]|uniref:protein ALWAYS EARLY 2-like isoform X2 n=1 Tax=Papaver somniferum TaxID=3469 RepID=UPI000E6FECD4|nr:protein ALWAYS EARLY 2-like isoform X2 [Papaver somniferum]
MATRKYRSINNKQFGKLNEESPDIDGGSGGNKSRQRKRKLTDMLGPQWSNEDLKRFYEAFRKYDKDWKKVAGAVRNRSAEMVEALYHMNRAYLSLPVEKASVAGLTAMMTDHYSMLHGSESDRESDDAPGVSQKPAKRARAKYQVNGSKGTDANVPDFLKLPPVSSNNGCFSVKKRRTIGGRHAVGKRTPRYPVSHTSDKHESEKFVTPNKRGLKSDLDEHDEEVSHGEVLTLAEALQRAASPQVSDTPKRRSEHLRPPSSRKSERRKQFDWEKSSTKHRVITDENYLEDSLGSGETENGDFYRNSSYMMDARGVGTVGVQKKANKSLGRKPNRDEDWEACSGTNEGLNLSYVKEQPENEVTDSRYGRPRKKNKHLKEDVKQALDGLTLLANMSLKIGQASADGSESSVQFKEERGRGSRGHLDNFSRHETFSTNRQRDKSNFSGVKEKSLREVEVTTSKSSRSTKVSTFDVNFLTEEKKPRSQTTIKMQKLKRKHLASKSPTNESNTDLLPDEREQTEALEEYVKRSTMKAKRVGPAAVVPKQGNSFKPPELTSSNADPVRPGTDAALSTEKVPTPSQVFLPTKYTSRRKMNLQKALIHRVSNFFEDLGNKRPGKHTSQDGTLDIKEKLCRCLSSPMLRRWCAFEWFYNAIDYPWFAKKEFVEYLNHVRLGHVPRLTRAEWGVIRSSLGKPRRLSQQFLREEKEKLEQYRESVRTHYTELRNGTRDGLPTDLARPLSVGQRVIACHPRTREFHDGSVLTVDRNRCRVQFDRHELGVEFVMDIDCMPLNALENMPEALRRQNIAAGRLSENLNDPKLNNQSKDKTTGGYKSIAPCAKLETTDVSSQISSPIYPTNTLIKKAEGDTVSDIAEAKAAANEMKAAYTQPCSLAQLQAREADTRALSELSRALEKKEALVSELSRMNDEVQENQIYGENSLKDYDPFKKQYAKVLIQLKDGNDQVSSDLIYLRKRNTYQGDSPPWQTSKPGSGVPVGPFNSIDASGFLPQEAASHVVGILESSRVKAQTMVDVAVQELLSCKDGEDAFGSIGEALDSASTHKNGTEVRSFTSTDPINGGSFHYQDAATNSHISKPVTAVYSNGITQNNSTFDANEVQIPKDLISSCLATLLMVQTCTEERQYPPAEVAQILDSAFTSLHPCCSQNLPIYQDIRLCMGLVKNQILALIPT